MKLVVCSICENNTLKHVSLHWRVERKAFSTEDLFCDIALFAGGMSYVFNFNPNFYKKKSIYSLEKMSWPPITVF